MTKKSPKKTTKKHTAAAKKKGGASPAKKRSKPTSSRNTRRGAGERPKRRRIKLTAVNGLSLNVISGSVDVFKAADPVTPVPIQVGTKYASVAGDEFKGNGDPHHYSLDDATVGSVVDVTNGAAATDSDLVEIVDASFFNSVTSYYDEDGQTSFTLEADDGVIGIRG